MLFNTIVVATAVSAASVTWRCSTQGDPWRLLPTGSRLHAPPSTDICTQVPGTDCWGNDLRRVLGLTNAAACCDECKATPGCAAWTFDTTASHAPFCFVKSACGSCTGAQCHANVTVVSGAGAVPRAPLNISVNTSQASHTMEGFGGCFNEKGWDALAALDSDARAEVLEDLFGASGLRWSVNRMPLGSSDFADSYYSLDDTAGDLAIENLTLARDRLKLLPFIAQAAEVNPELRVWASPWTGPTWMKDSAPQVGHNEGCGSLSANATVRASYALYLAKAVRALRAAGVRLEHLAVQNEPNQGNLWNNSTQSCGNSYPKMHWTGEELRAFVRDHLGPAFAAQGLAGEDGVGILLATFPVNAYEDYVEPTLSDPAALRYLAGVGLQYAGVGMIARIKAAAPSLKTWETETPCGSGTHDRCLGNDMGSWSWGQGQWSYMRSFIESGASVYSQWNMVLDQTGESGWGWSQCAPVTVNTATKRVTHEGSYWATKHFSNVVDAGATGLATTGDNARCVEVNGACGCARGCAAQGDAGATEAISFRNPDGTLIVVAQNTAGAESQVNVLADGKVVLSEHLPARSMSTFTVSQQQ